MGVWPGLDERPVIAHTVRDWLAKLQLVAAGAGLTTISASMASAVPPGVRVLTVHGGPLTPKTSYCALPPSTSVGRDC